MHVRRLRPGRGATAWVIGLLFLIAIGCSPQEELALDPGVSPFYPGDAGSAKTAGSGVSGTAEGRAGTSAGSADWPVSEAPLRPEDVERQLRIALRTAEKGDSSRAVPLLERILALEPLNREALLGRSAIAMDQAQQATSTPERAAAMEQALAPLRTLRRAYEKQTKREKDLYAQVLYEEARLQVSLGREDRALAVLKEAYDGGFDPFDQIEHDPSMAPLRESEGYRALLMGIDAANLAKARSLVKDHLDKPLTMSFDFTLPDLDGKPISLGQLKGKVVIIDLWGTWCKPCREAIPGLIQLYRKHRRRGLEIVGIDYEQNAPDQATAVQMVRRFVQGAGIPYLLVMGDQATLEKIPDFRGFPTSIVIDRSGKVRVLINENSGGTIDALDAIVQVLLAQPATPPAGKGAAAQPR
jgi:thiol-disulfide isomerase/thioredoxin